jgi:hypothetical protein
MTLSIEADRLDPVGEGAPAQRPRDDPRDRLLLAPRSRQKIRLR